MLVLAFAVVVTCVAGSHVDRREAHQQFAAQLAQLRDTQAVLEVDVQNVTSILSALVCVGLDALPAPGTTCASSVPLCLSFRFCSVVSASLYCPSVPLSCTSP